MDDHTHMWRLLGLTGDRLFCRCGAIREPNGEGGYCIRGRLRGAERIPPRHVPDDPNGIILQEA